jgi:predicted DNA-binding transcriptional regulator AlpA
MVHETAFDPLLSESEVSDWLHASRATLQRLRADGSGPPFVRLSERRIGYRKSAIEQWLDARTINRAGPLCADQQPPLASIPTDNGGAE